MSSSQAPRRAGLSLAERFQRTADDQATVARDTGMAGAQEQTPPPSSGRHADPGGRHCWVGGLPGAPGVWPGLLTAWRQVSGSWQGHVTYAVKEGADTVLVQSWVPAEHLQPL